MLDLLAQRCGIRTEIRFAFTDAMQYRQRRVQAMGQITEGVAVAFNMLVTIADQGVDIFS